MEVKVSELNGIALDWAVGVCRGVDMRVVTLCYNRKMLVTQKSVDLGGEDIYWMPSEDHEQSGVIIDEENIATSPLPGGMWRAYVPSGTHWVPCAGHDIEVFNWVFKQEGDTRMVAAMRCYVLSKMGEVVDVPEDLL